MDQLLRERPGCLLRSSDPEAELRYLVEARSDEIVGKQFGRSSSQMFRKDLNWESWDVHGFYRMIFIKRVDIFIDGSLAGRVVRAR